ncbi:PIN domain-containing protein [uncultured Thiohalocapsa sp.]|uniref:PIN domain-containing protein n=1 Tax=uncultured Thiohalocapsa sp. TaxID=768990 RepID=UPI00345DECA2
MVSAISFNNVFYIVRKARDLATARRALVLLRDVFASVAPDQRILNQAIDSDIPDFEDALQFYSALHARADYLLTRNVGDFPAGILPVLAPDEFLALLDRAVDES